MNDVPITNQGEDQQQKGYEQQAGSFRGINRVPAVFVGGIVLAPSGKHTSIVRPSVNRQRDLPTTPHALAGVNSFVRALRVLS